VAHLVATNKIAMQAKVLLQVLESAGRNLPDSENEARARRFPGI